MRNGCHLPLYTIDAIYILHKDFQLIPRAIFGLLFVTFLSP